MMQIISKELDELKLQAKNICAIKEHLYSALKDEGVILSLKNGKYYGLNEIGCLIWLSIQTPTTIEQIQTAVMKEYEVDEKTCYETIKSFLQQMADEELVEICNEKDS